MSIFISGSLHFSFEVCYFVKVNLFIVSLVNYQLEKLLRALLFLLPS